MRAAKEKGESVKIYIPGEVTSQLKGKEGKIIEEKQLKRTQRYPKSDRISKILTQQQKGRRGEPFREASVYQGQLCKSGKSFQLGRL